MLNNKTDGWYDELLPDTQVVTHVTDSKCDSKHAAAGVWRLADWPRHHGHELTASKVQQVREDGGHGHRVDAPREAEHLRRGRGFEVLVIVVTEAFMPTYVRIVVALYLLLVLIVI